MTEQKQPKPGIPPLRMPEGLQSKYSNMARISHTPSEMIFDFATMLPGTHPEVVARVLMSPMGAKMFLQALTENVARYEANFGPIKVPVGTTDLASSLFRNIQPPDKNNPHEPPEKDSPPESPEQETPPDSDPPESES
jgi:hypothetical protein